MKVNPKKTNSARRKRPVNNNPSEKWVLENDKYKRVLPANPKGQNHQQRRIEKAKNR